MSKRVYLSGAQKRKLKSEAEAVAKKSKSITSFFTPLQKQKADELNDDHAGTIDSTTEDIQQEKTKPDQIVALPDPSADNCISDKDPTQESEIFNDSQWTSLLEKKYPTDKGHFNNALTAEQKKFIIYNGPCQPVGPFPRDHETNARFSPFFYQSRTKLE